MKKKLGFGKILADTGNNAKELFKKSKEAVVQATDQNDDGKLDYKDVSIIAGSVENTVKKAAQVMKEQMEEKNRIMELKTLRPVFKESLNDEQFFMSKFIRITERDKKHAESEVCKGSIGYVSEQKGLRIVNIFQDSIDAFGLTFYPNYDSEFYYVDPSDGCNYIALDDYFGYLKLARVNELQKLAQDLGATHFRVTYKEEKTVLAEKKTKVKTDVMKTASVDLEHEQEEKKYSTIEVAAEMKFPGHDPVTPRLKYLKNDQSIQTLVEMRMDRKGAVLHQRFMLKLSNSSGLKEKDALKIDAVLKGMKCAGNATVVSEVQNESRRYLEYEIDF